MGDLQVKDVSLVFPGQRLGEDVHALKNINLTIKDGDFVVVLGTSGCGKTTLLNLMAGFISPSQGEILLGGKKVIGPGADRGVVFQKHALFPWLNVIENVEFGLKLHGVPREQRRKMAAQNLELVGLDAFHKSAIYHLSGGMQQRVGIARALTCNPAMLLMDEPMASLDTLTRETLQELLLDIWDKTKKTFFFITHSVEEALFLATRLIVMSPRPGRITNTYDLTFQRSYLQSRNARSVKSDPRFISMRETVLDIVYKEKACSPTQVNWGYQ